ncbi:hypothetical protein [Mycobacterium sp. SP-6446]|uniref:hypothetical protein n=1 Tax=Mycobacterium sp. SP-6446 TaxID=1834162 RepID=UPI00158C6303|nr:hypothetical protein [Mycobacterium sp. SP-6446]
MSRLLNPLVGVLAGRRFVPVIARVHHVGRRSGKPYVTSTGAHITGDTIVIPLSFGNQSDWARNVRRRRALRRAAGWPALSRDAAAIRRRRGRQTRCQTVIQRGQPRRIQAVWYQAVPVSAHHKLRGNRHENACHT